MKTSLNIKQYIQKFVSPKFSPEKDSLPFRTITKTYPAGTVLTAIGEIEKRAFLILSGKVKIGVYNDKMELRIINFFFAGQFISAYSSFLAQMPTDVTLITFSECTVEIIDHDQIMEACEEGNVIALKLMFHETKKAYIQNSTRAKELMVVSPEEMYKSIVNDRMELFSEVELQEIAAYINVTPETLSRIRKKNK
ncbi:MAG: Crp/Fnr family transcriptional regulator [Chitinophagaceae bacterium]|nr:Crp/Fnr family transcriptional regulator [Chitinophagaceae bacterium]